MDLASVPSPSHNHFYDSAPPHRASSSRKPITSSSLPRGPSSARYGESQYNPTSDHASVSAGYHTSPQYTPVSVTNSTQPPRGNSYHRISPQISQYSSHQQQHSLQRVSTQISPSGSNTSATASVAHPQHRRQDSASTSASSIARVPSGHSNYMAQMNGSSASAGADTYVARLRRAKATVWSARGQREEVRIKDEKAKKNFNKRDRVGTMKNKLSSTNAYGRPTSLYSFEGSQYLNAHPRQLMPRLSATEAGDEEIHNEDPFLSELNPDFFPTTATASTKASVITKTTHSNSSQSVSLTAGDKGVAGNSPSRSGTPTMIRLNTSPSVITASLDSDGRTFAGDRSGSPVEDVQLYLKPPSASDSPVREMSTKRRSRDDDIGRRQSRTGGGTRLFVVNASPSESEEEYEDESK